MASPWQPFANPDNRGLVVEIDFDQVELGLIVNLTTLREMLKSLSINGKRWWIASDPHDSLTTRSITIGHGDSRCIDRLSTLYFLIPVLGDEAPRRGTDGIVLLFDPNTSVVAEPGCYIEDGRVVEILWKIPCASTGQSRALKTTLQEESQSQKGEL
jgi:hypothetical protein